jgi:hypothetical protein
MASDKIEKVPWKHDEKNFIGCNFAYSDLTRYIPQVVSQPKGELHPKTFAAASGAIAGFAAQQTLLSQRPNFSIEALNETSTNDGLFIVRSPRGERYIYGDPLKLMVFCKDKTPTPITARLWEWAVGGAVVPSRVRLELRVA